MLYDPTDEISRPPSTIERRLNDFDSVSPTKKPTPLKRLFPLPYWISRLLASYYYLLHLALLGSLPQQAFFRWSVVLLPRRLQK